MQVTMTPVADLVAHDGNAKLHPAWQVAQIAESIREFGFADPVGIWHDERGRAVIVEGHGRVMAARELGMDEVPTISLDHMTDEERRAYGLSTYGGLVPMIVVVAFNIIFPVMMGKMATSQGGWVTLVMIFAVPMTFLGLLRFFVVKETYNVDAKAGEKLELKDVFTVLKNNKYIYAISFAGMIMNFCTNMGVGVYYFKEIVGNVGLLGALAAVQMVGLPMMFILPQVLKRTTVIRVIRVGIVVTIIGYVLNFFAGANFPILAVCAVLQGVGTVPISMLSGLIIIDCAEFNEYKGLHRLEGSLSAVNGFATKIGAGLGAGMLGILLGAAGYDGMAAAQTDSALLMIRLLFSLIPAALYFCVYLALHMCVDHREPVLGM